MNFPCRDRFGYAWGSYVVIKHLCVTIELDKAKGKCVATKLARIGRISVATESYVAHNKARCAQDKRERRRTTRTTGGLPCTTEALCHP